jgi:hypothetical protein
MWQEAAAVLEDGLTVYPGFVTAMAAHGAGSTTSLGQTAKAKAILEDVVKTAPGQSPRASYSGEALPERRAHRTGLEFLHGHPHCQSLRRGSALPEADHNRRTDRPAAGEARENTSRGSGLFRRTQGREPCCRRCRLAPAIDTSEQGSRGHTRECIGAGTVPQETCGDDRSPRSVARNHSIQTPP